MKKQKHIYNQIFIYVILFLVFLIIPLSLIENHTEESIEEVKIIGNGKKEDVLDFYFKTVDDEILLEVDNQTRNRILSIDYKINYENHVVENTLKQDLSSKSFYEIPIEEKIQSRGENLDTNIGEVTRIYFLDQNRIKIAHLKDGKNTEIVDTDYFIVENKFSTLVPKFLFKDNTIVAKLYNQSDLNIIDYMFFYELVDDNNLRYLTFNNIKSNQSREITIDSEKGTKISNFIYKYIYVSYLENGEIKSLIFYPEFNLSIRVDSNTQELEFLK